MALGLQEAVERATEILRELYPNESLNQLLLEEIERVRSEKGYYWNVTLGFARPGTMGSLTTAVTASPPRDRAYKRIRINEETGEFEGMTDRLLEESAR
jgi:hypothetical protein